MKTIATMHIRSQHACGSGVAHGPDTYVAVTIAPLGVVVPKYLNAKVLAKRGIEFIYMGQGYREHTGPRSILGQTIKYASEYVAGHNATQTAVLAIAA